MISYTIEQTKKNLLMVLVLSVVLFGCLGCEQDNKNVLSELDTINKRLDRIEKALSLRGEIGSKGPDLMSLGNIVFPENPTRENLKIYVYSIIEATADQNTFSSDDPQIRLLEKVGEENIDILINAASDLHRYNYYLNEAINHLASDKSKDLILAALPQNPELIKTVVNYGWELEVKELLVERLRDSSSYLPDEWIKAVAGFQDPSTYENLIYHFINAHNRYRTYKIIKDLPGINLNEAVIKAWEKAKYNGDWERVTMAGVAIKYGRKDALEILIMNVDSSKFDYYRQDLDQSLIQHTELAGTIPEIKKWYNENKDNLYFDEQARKFKVRK